MVAALAALLVVAGLSGWIQDAPGTLGNWTYGFGALMAFLELSSLVGLPAPFEVGVVLSGAAAGEGEIALPPLILLVWVAAAAGESVNFATGDHFGRPFLERHGPATSRHRGEAGVDRRAVRAPRRVVRADRALHPVR